MSQQREREKLEFWRERCWFACIVRGDDSAAECVSVHAGVSHRVGMLASGLSAARRFNFCKQSDGGGLEDHTASPEKQQRAAAAAAEDGFP